MINKDHPAYQHLNEEQKEIITSLHHARSIILSTAGSSIMAAKLSYEIFIQIEYSLQEAWGFDKNSNYFRIWEYPYCDCPKMDNNDRYPSGFYVLNQDCPIHGKLPQESSKTDKDYFTNDDNKQVYGTKRIYLCGPINGKSDIECKQWREQASHILCSCEPYGSFEIVDPMTRDYRGIEDQNVTKIVEGDLADIMSCDYVLVNVEEASWGTAMELFYAKRTGKQVIAFTPCERVSPWLRYHCDVIYDDVETACNDIISREQFAVQMQDSGALDHHHSRKQPVSTTRSKLWGLDSISTLIECTGRRIVEFINNILPKS